MSPIPVCSRGMRIGRRFERWLRGRFGNEALTLAGPLTFQALIYSLLGVVDRIMVGALAETAISGVGIGGQVLFFVNTLAGTVAAAVSILAAQYRGAGDRRKLSELTATGILVCSLLGLASIVLLWWLAPVLSLWLTNGSESVAAVSAWYLRVILVSIPAVLVTFVLTGVMRSLGDTRTPMISSLTALAANTLLNALLINGYAGLPRLEVTGAALATCLAQIIGCAVASWSFFRAPFAGHRFTLSDLRACSLNVAVRLAVLTWPIALDAFFWQAASLAYTRVVGLAGDAALAAYFIFSGVRGLGYIPLGALGTAASIMVGRFLGAGRRARADICVRHALTLAVGASLVMGLMLWIVARPYLWFFQVDPVVAEQARRLIVWFAFILPLEAAIVVYAFSLRAGGDALAVSCMTATSFWVVGIPASYLLGIAWQLGLTGIFLGMACEALVKALLFRFRARSGVWMRNLTASC